MKTFDTAHQAAMAHAGAHKTRVTNCLSYADRLIRERAIRPVVNGNGQIKHWIIVGPRDWWLVGGALAVRRLARPRPEILKGPFATKREALEAAGSASSKKLCPGCYEVAKGLLVTTTEFAQGMGLNP